MRRALGVGSLLLCIGSVPPAHAQTHTIAGRIVIEHRSRHDSTCVWVDSLHSAVTDSLGRYVIAGVEDGEYLVQVRAPHCLYHIVDTVRVSGGDVAGIDDTLLAADPVTDGRINLLDVGKILLHYNAADGEPAWDEGLDIDGSGRIDSLDIALLMQHWKETGDDPPSSRIAVTAPDAETVWYRGKLGTAAWSTGNLGGNVSISLYRGSIWTSTIAALTVNDGSHGGFLLPRSLPVGSDYRVRVSRDAFNVDYSDAFRIDAQIEVLEPKWTTVWLLGQENVEVLWDTVDLGGAVAIVLHKGESAVDTIASPTANDGSFAEYDVSDELTPGTDYRVQVVYDEARSAFSDSFEVKREIGPIVVVEPNASTRWVHEQRNVPIVWETGHLGGTVSIFLWKGAIQGWLPVDTIALSTPNDGSFEEYDVTQWTIYAGTDYRVQVVFDKDHTGLSDFFEIEFALTPGIGVTEPNAGTVWTLGRENVSIFWNGGPPGDVSIDLYEGGVVVDAIAPAAPNTGSFVEYDVPAGLAPGTQYRVRVTFTGGHVEESGEFEIRASEETGWSFLYPFPQGNGLGGVAFVDASIGTAVGNSGTIMRTADGGATWTMQWSGTRNSLYGVAFIGASAGIAVGARGTILRTMDGGATWSPVRSGTSATLNAVTFTSAMTATIVGDGGVVLQSVDGGITWAGYIPAANYVYGHSIDLKSVSFSDANHGWAVGGSGTSWSDCEYVILRTTDGGVSWTKQRLQALAEYVVTGVAFSDSSTGVAVGYRLSRDPDGACCYISGYVIRTSDGGVTWSQFGGWRPALYGVTYIGQNTFVAVGGGVIRSDDGGLTWSEAVSLGANLRAVSFPNPTRGMGVGDRGAVFTTINAGADWTSRTQSVTSYRLNRLFFPSSMTGFAGSQLGLIYRTQDGGGTWLQKQTSTGYELSDVSFASASRGMAASYVVRDCEFCLPNGGAVVATVNGGASWVTKLTRSPALFLGISVIDSLTATVVGDLGLILRTTDFGATWVDQMSGTSATLMGVCFMGADTGTAIGSLGTILRTTDGGGMWSPQQSGTSAHLTDLFFTDANTGTIVGRGGTILRTTDGGANWVPQTSGTAVDLSGVFFSDGNTGTVVGNAGTILRTTDGGATWLKQPCPASYNLRDVWFFDSLTGIAVGENGVMLKTTTGGE